MTGYPSTKVSVTSPVARFALYIVPIVLFEIWNNVPTLGFPYAIMFSHSFVSELLMY
jgi:hypothetical protein